MFGRHTVEMTNLSREKDQFVKTCSDLEAEGEFQGFDNAAPSPAIFKQILTKMELLWTKALENDKRRLLPKQAHVKKKVFK